MRSIGRKALDHGVLAVALFSTLLGEVANGDPPVFTRQVERCTGGGGLEHGNVLGQDSAIILPYESEVRFFFGDTRVLRDGRVGWLANSMASTSDLDASDGLSLQYYHPDEATTVLLPEEPEATVWLSAAFSVGADIYAFYQSVPSGWPEAPPLGAGLAVMRDGVPPFERTSLYVSPDDPFYETGFGRALVVDDYVYIFGRLGNGFPSTATLKRVPLDAVEDRGAYEFWTTTGWSPTAETVAALFTDAAVPAVQSGWSSTSEMVAALFSESGVPAVHWSEYHQQYLTLYTMIFSPFGFLSSVAMRTAPELTGPWSDATIVNGAPGTGWGSNYGVDWSSIFSREGGRVLYFTSTDWESYNVYLYETSFEYARSVMRTPAREDFAYEVRPRSAGAALRPPRVGRHRLPLRASGKTVVGLRLVGTSFFPVAAPTTMQLTLPIRPLRSGPMSFALRITAKPPNRPAFDRRVPGDLDLREMLASVDTTVTLPAGATELVLTDEIAPLLEAAMAHADWVPARINTLTLLLERTDAEARTIRIDTTAPMGAAQAALCWGWCPPGPALAAASDPGDCAD